jgi:hypothetical protein
MKSKTIVLLTAIWAVCCAGAPAFSGDFLGDRHKAAGLDCKDCHGDKDKRDGVDMDKCLSCHESYAKLKLSPRTAKFHPNPHDGHFVDLDCNNCHHGHKAAENYCDQCHKK